LAWHAGSGDTPFRSTGITGSWGIISGVDGVGRQACGPAAPTRTASKRLWS
jgi:hypothetical protein